MKSKIYRSSMAILLIFAMLFQQVSAIAEGNTAVDPQTGLASQYEYLQYDAGTAGTLYVSQYTTKPHVRRNDLTLGGNRMPVEIELWYDEENLSNDLTALANPYGYGWMTSYNQLLEYQNLNERYAWQNANGTWIYFEDSGEITGEDASIWEEAAATEEAATGAVLYLEDEALPSSYTDVTIVWEDYNYTFDAAGRLSSVSDAYGNTLSVTYLAQTGPAISLITDGVGRRYAFSYTNGWLSSIACQDSSGIPITVQNTAIAISYTITNGLLEETSLGANYTYDTNRRITALWGMDGIGYTVAYSGSTQEVTVVTKQAAMGTLSPANGKVTEISRNNGEVTITEDNLEQVQSFDNYGRPLTVEINELSEVGGIPASELLYGIYYIYENVMQPNGTMISQLTDVQIYDGESTQSLYGDGNESGNAQPSSLPETPQEGGEEETGDPEEDPFSYTETHDQYGNTLSETNSVTTSSGTLSQTTLYTYSSDGNYLTSVTSADGITTTYSFNSLSGILESVTDSLSHTTSYSYNALRELTAASLPVTGLTNGNSMSAAYSYTDGRISTVTYGPFVYSFSYDIWGNITQVQMNNSLLVSYNYGMDPSKGQIQSLTYGNGQSVYYSYNDLDQIIGVSYNNQEIRFRYTYAETGNLASIRDMVNGHTTLYTEDGMELRDSQNNLLYSLAASEIDADTLLKTIFNTSYSYTSSLEEISNNRTQKSQTVLKGNTSLYADNVVYDALGRVLSKAFSLGTNSVTQSFTYTNSNGNAGNLVGSYEVYSSAEDLTGSYQYTYDGNGNITGVQKSFSQDLLVPIGGLSGDGINAGGSGPIFPPDPIIENDLWDLSGTESYTYDEAGQLKTAVYSDGRSYSYTYNTSGNIITNQKNVPLLDSGWEVHLLNYTYNQKGQLTGYTDSVSLNTVSYTLDTMGNPISIVEDHGSGNETERILSWGEGRMLTGIQYEDNSSYTYVYDSDGLRIQKIYAVGKNEYVTDYIWADGHLLAERRPDGTVITILYDSENSPAGFLVEKTISGVTNVNQYSYLKNLQGDITHILDEDGETVVVYRYDPWGDWTAEGDTAIAALNPCTYRGYYRDQESGWYYLQSRYYDPEIGRFLNVDSIINALDLISINACTYCENNPINHIDSNGLYAISITFSAYIISLLSSALAGLVASITTAIASIKAAIGSSWIIPICIAAAAVAIGAIIYAVNKVRSLEIYAQQVRAAVYTAVAKGGVNPNNLSNNTVYVIASNDNKKVWYVGRTTNYPARRSAHIRSGKLCSGRKMLPVATGLSLNAARALEQTLIMAFSLDALLNIINSISPANWGKFTSEVERMQSLLISYWDPE